MATSPTVVFTGRRQVVVEDRDVPTPQGDQLLIRTEVSLISTGTELTVLCGETPPGSVWDRMSQYPVVPGYCNIGHVVDVGPDAGREWIGRRVGTLAGHAQFAAVSAGQAFVVPDGLASDVASVFTIGQIAFAGVRLAKLEIGTCAVVYGQGLVGQVATRLAWLNGARPVLAVDVARGRLDRLPAWPGLVPVNAGEVDVPAAIEEHSKGRGADVVFEVTGDPKLIPSFFKGLKRQGKFVVMSSPRGKTEFDFHDLCNSPSYTIIGAHNGSHPAHATPYNQWTGRRDAELFLDLTAAGELALEPLISHRIKGHDAPEAYQMLLEDRTQAMGVLLEWS